MARQSANVEDSDSPAWKLLKEQLALDAEVDDTLAESPAHITSVMGQPDDDPELSDRDSVMAERAPMSDRELVLLTPLSPPRQRWKTVGGSLVVHVLAGAVIWFSLGYKPPSARVITESEMVRELELNEVAEEMARANEHTPAPPKPDHKIQAPAAKAEAAPAPRPMIQAKLGPQTLIQPDLPNPIALSQKIPVPQVMLWAPSKTVVKKITPPLPHKPAAADVVPNLERPNQELKLADVNVSSSFKPSPKALVAPSTTSPIAVRDSIQTQQVPSSVSQISAVPTAAAILSLSDIHMQSGTAALPGVSEAQASSTHGMGTGQTQNASSAAGNGSSTSSQNGHGNAGIATGSTAPGAGLAGNGTGRLTSTAIALPKNGQFGSVIVGDALNEKFPEIEDVWGRRMAYTAYLHVGLAKSWILQYSLPRGAGASSGPSVSHLEAPWPYNIIRPNLAPGSIGGDALMIHGYVNPAGRFEGLSVVFPEAFSSAQFVLAALQQWEFRPAIQNGQAIMVEVLLIIPDQLE